MESKPEKNKELTRVLRVQTLLQYGPYTGAEGGE